MFAVDGPIPGGSEASAVNGGGNNFFSEGIIGAGTSSNITGDINLYHIGEQPDFRLRYFHDGYDGFSGHEAGEGYSDREELIEAEINYDTEQIKTDILVSYNERETGLQGQQADYYSMTRRTPTVETQAEWLPSDRLTLRGVLGAEASRIQMNSLTPDGFSIFNLDPEAQILYGTEKVQIGAGINYGIRGEFNGNGVVQDLGGGLLFSAALADIFSINADANVLWHDWTEFYFPFEVGISGIASSFDYELKAVLKRSILTAAASEMSLNWHMAPLLQTLSALCR